MLLTTNGNFMPTNREQAAAIGSEAAVFLTESRMAALTERIGADGVELLPIRSPLYTTLQLPGKHEHASLFVASHESFLGLAQEQPSPEAGIRPDDLAENQHDASGLMSLAAPIVMPKGEASLHSFSRIARQLGNAATMTCTLFPDPEGRISVDRWHAALFPGGAAIQYTPDVFGLFGIHPGDKQAPQKFVHALKQRNVKAVEPTFHGGRLGKIVRKRIDQRAVRQELLMQDMLGEVHVELARTDMARVDPERVSLSIKEGVALFKGDKDAARTNVGATMRDIKEAAWRGNILVELTLGGVAAILHERRMKVNKNNVLDVYRAINNSLREQM